MKIKSIYKIIIVSVLCCIFAFGSFTVLATGDLSYNDPSVTPPEEETESNPESVENMGKIFKYKNYPTFKYTNSIGNKIKVSNFKIIAVKDNTVLDYSFCPMLNWDNSKNAYSGLELQFLIPNGASYDSFSYNAPTRFRFTCQFDFLNLNVMGNNSFSSNFNFALDCKSSLNNWYVKTDLCNMALTSNPEKVFAPFDFNGQTAYVELVSFGSSVIVNFEWAIDTGVKMGNLYFEFTDLKGFEYVPENSPFNKKYKGADKDDLDNWKDIVNKGFSDVNKNFDKSFGEISDNFLSRIDKYSSTVVAVSSIFNDIFKISFFKDVLYISLALAIVPVIVGITVKGVGRTEKTVRKNSKSNNSKGKGD